MLDLIGKRYNLFITVLLFFVSIAASVPGFASETKWLDEMINFSHLDFLKFSFKDFQGKTISSWAIYAEPEEKNNPDGRYRLVEAPGEGYACVDDVARIALIYMLYYQKTKDSSTINTAKDAFDFLLYMQESDGSFYNFIDKNGKINKEGETSKKGLDWWTARAFWALGTGIGFFQDIDPDYSKKLESAFLKTFVLLKEYRQNPQISPLIAPQYKLRGIEPGNLVYDSGALTSLYVLGLLEYYKYKPSDDIKEMITVFCNAMVQMEETSPDRYPLTGVHYPTLWNTNMVHLYGNRQVQALAEAGVMFNEKKWIESAQREVNIAYPMLLTSWGVPFGLSPGPEVYPQIAYSAETIISNLQAVYQVSNREKYAVMAGLLGAWFFGDNPAGESIYLPYKGRCLDGIDQGIINTHSGAESTIEALWALLKLEDSPGRSFLNYRQIPAFQKQPVIVPCSSFTVKSGDAKFYERILEGGNVEKVIHFDSPALIEGQAKITHPDLYRVFVVYQKQGIDGTSRIKIRAGEREKSLYLTGSNSEYIYNCGYVMRLNIRDEGTIPLSIAFEENEGAVKIHSIILQPQLQMKVWGKGKEYILMIYNSSDRERLVPVDFSGLAEDWKNRFLSGDDVMKVNLPGLGWILFIP